MNAGRPSATSRSAVSTKGIATATEIAQAALPEVVTVMGMDVIAL